MPSLIKDLKDCLPIFAIISVIVAILAVLLTMLRLVATIKRRQEPPKPVKTNLRPLRLPAMVAQRSTASPILLSTPVTVPSPASLVPAPRSPSLIGCFPSLSLTPKALFLGLPKPKAKGLRSLVLPTIVMARTPKPTRSAVCVAPFLILSHALYLVVLYERLLAFYALQSLIVRRLAECAVYCLSWSSGALVYLAPPSPSALVGRVLGSQGLLSKLASVQARQDTELCSLEEGQLPVDVSL